MASQLPNIVIAPEKFQLVVGVTEDCTIELTNVGYETVMYRMLTTARNRYFVKHTKGLIRANSTSQVVISLNRNHLLDDTAPDVKILKDDFRVECAYVGENDVLEPNLQNVPQLLKDRKAADPQSILRKMLRCHVLLDASEQGNGAAGGQRGGRGTRVASPGNKAGQEGAAAAGAAPPLAGGGHKMTAQEMEVNTLLEQKKRKGGSSEGALSNTRIMVALALVLAVVAVFVLTSFD